MIRASESLVGNINSTGSLKGKINNGIEKIYPQLENLTIDASNEKQIFNHENSYGYDEVVVNPISLQDKTVTPTIEEQVIKADEGFTGLNQVNIGKVTSEIDSNIIAENIKNEVEILGVKGNFVGSKYAPRVLSFYNYTGSDLTEELQQLDTSNMTTMSYMFYYCSKLQNIDLSNFNTSNVTYMNNMFSNCSMLEKIDLSSFNTPKLASINNMFQSCPKLTEIDLSNFDTSNVTQMDSTFYACNILEKVNLKNLNTQNLARLYAMFRGCKKLKEVDFTGWNTSKVTYFENMFYQCYSLERLDLSSFTLESASNMSSMFYSCVALKHLDIRNMDFTINKPRVSLFLSSIPTDCLIIVKDEANKTYVQNTNTQLTNIKTVAEL